MKHLIIYSHINSNSFSHAILDEVVKASEAKGAEVKVRDLNAMGFNPILSATDMDTFAKGEVPADIKAEQDLVTWADTISFIYPLWWGHMPAMLKGYIDRVFAYGFAYQPTESGVKGLLGNKRMLLFTPMGTSYQMYQSVGMIDAFILTVDKNIFGFCGITDIEHLHLGEVTMVDDSARKKMLDEVRQLVNKKL